MINKRTRNLLYSDNLWYFGSGLLGPLFAIFSERLGGNILDISWAWATYLIVAGVFTILIGKISDQFGKEKIMILGYFLNALFTFGYLLVKTPMHLFIIQIALGFAYALAAPTWNALYAKYENKLEDGYAWGLAGGQANIVTGIAVFLGGIIVSFDPTFTTLFIAMGAVNLIAAIYQTRILFIKD